MPCQISNVSVHLKLSKCGQYHQCFSIYTIKCCRDISVGSFMPAVNQEEHVIVRPVYILLNSLTNVGSFTTSRPLLCLMVVAFSPYSKQLTNVIHNQSLYVLWQMLNISNVHRLKWDSQQLALRSDTSPWRPTANFWALKTFWTETESFV